MSDYHRLVRDLFATIRLGYEVEREDPNIAFDAVRC
jgi:hypothetical protein